jgi:hypothetical protein
MCKPGYRYICIGDRKTLGDNPDADGVVSPTSKSAEWMRIILSKTGTASKDKKSKSDHLGTFETACASL